MVSRLVDLGILVEITGYSRNRRFRYDPYIRLFTDELQLVLMLWPAEATTAPDPSQRLRETSLAELWRPSATLASTRVENAAIMKAVFNMAFIRSHVKLSRNDD